MSTTEMSNSEFILDVADLLGRDAPSRSLTVTGSVDWRIEMIAVMDDPPLEADLVLHPVSGGVAVTGRVRFTTVDTCYRCLGETLTDRDAPIGALFDKNSDDDESYPLLGGKIDITQVLIDEVLLSLPIVENCGDDCPGVVSTVQSDLNTGFTDDGSGTRSPFAVLEGLLDSDERTE